MMVVNRHGRTLEAPARTVGALLDGLAGADDRLWPHGRWPAMRFDRPLGVGASGGHGPIRYRVTDFEPGRRIRFAFLAPSGFDGFHQFTVEAVDERRARLEHLIVMRTHGPARLLWPVLYRPLHDALIEDALDKAGEAVRPGSTTLARHSRTVRLLRALARRAERDREPTVGRPASQVR